MIALAERAEAYIKREQQNRQSNSGSINTRSNLENRPEKQQRINEAIAEHN